MVVRKSRKISLSAILYRQWFLIGILVSILIAATRPSLGAKGGPLKPEYTVKYGAVSIIFLISGFSLKTDQIFHTMKQYKLHLFVQLFTFVVIPIFIHILNNILTMFNINIWILNGLVTVACMPPPVSSAVILTRTSQGNEMAAIFNSVLGSFLGIFITPLALLLTLGSTTLVPLLSTIIQLTLTVIIPLFIGQIIRRIFRYGLYNLPLNSIGQLALLFVIYTTFCDTFLSHEADLSAIDVLITVFLVLAIQIMLLFLSYMLASSFKWFTPQDIVAIVFCSTHKSLTLGIPILRIMFHGYGHLSQISLPLLVYHPAQLIIGGLISTQFKDWVHRQSAKRMPV